MNDDKRSAARVAFSEDIMFARHSSHPYCYYGGTTIDCSPGGLCIQSRYEAVPGDNLSLRLIGNRLESFSSVDELSGSGEVRWCKPAGSEESPVYRIGLRYHGTAISALFKP